MKRLRSALVSQDNVEPASKRASYSMVQDASISMESHHPPPISNNPQTNMHPISLCSPRYYVRSQQATVGAKSRAADSTQLKPEQKALVAVVSSTIATAATQWLIEEIHRDKPNRATAALTYVAETLNCAHTNLTGIRCALAASLSDLAITTDWYFHNFDINHTRHNYASWQPPPDNLEWQHECKVMIIIRNALSIAIANFCPNSNFKVNALQTSIHIAREAAHQATIIQQQGNA